MATRRNQHHYIARRDALKRRSIALDMPCHLCGEPIDATLPYTDPMSWTADHLDAVAAGGAILGRLMPAHRIRRCNSSRGKKTVEEYLDSKPEKVKPTLTW